MLDDAIVIFSSDNGPIPTASGGAGGSAYPLRGRKLFLWEVQCGLVVALESVFLPRRLVVVVCSAPVGGVRVVAGPASSLLASGVSLPSFPPSSFFFFSRQPTAGDARKMDDRGRTIDPRDMCAAAAPRRAGARAASTSPRSCTRRRCSRRARTERRRALARLTDDRLSTRPLLVMGKAAEASRASRRHR